MDKFEEYEVVITPLDRFEKQITLRIWAESLENAQMCGEVLSGIYLD